MPHLRKVLSSVKSGRKQRKRDAAARMRSAESFDTHSSVGCNTPLSSRSMSIPESPPAYSTPTLATQPQYGNGHCENCNPNSTDISTNIEVFQMKMELAELRQRLKLLDENDKQSNGNGCRDGGGGESRSELLDLLQEKDEEISELNSTIETWQDKFQHIKDSLGEIQRERQDAREILTKQEQKNETLSRHLHIREKEVVNLVKRLAGEDERMKEISELKAASATMTKDLEETKEDSKRLKKENMQIRDELLNERKDKANMEREFGQYQSQNDEKNQSQKAELEALKNSSKLDHERINDMRKTVSELTSKIAEINAEKIASEKGYGDNMEKLKLSFEKREAESKKKMEEKFAHRRRELELDLEELRSKLAGKEEDILCLQEKVNGETKKSNSLQEELGKVSCDYSKKIQILENEITSITETVSALEDKNTAADSQVLDLRDALLQSQKSKDAFKQEAKKLKDTVTNLTAEHKDYSRKCEQESKQMREQFSRRENEIETQFREQIAVIEREREMDDEAAKSLISQRDEQIASLEETSSVLTQKLASFQSQVEKVITEKDKVQAENDKLDHVKMNLEAELRVIADELLQMKRKIQHHLDENDTLSAEVKCLKNKNSSLQSEKDEEAKKHEAEIKRSHILFGEKEAAATARHAEELIALEADFKRQVKIIEEKLKSKEDDLASCNKNISSQSNKIEGLVAELDKARRTWAEERHVLQVEMTETLAELEAMKIDITAKNARLEELNRDLACSRKDSDDAKKERQRLRSRILLLENETSVMSELENQMINLEKLVALLKQQKQKLEEESAKVTANLQMKLDSQIQKSASYQAEIQELIALENRKNAKISELQQELDQCNESVSNLTTEVAARDERIEKIKSEAEDRLSTAMTELQTARANLRDTEQNKKELSLLIGSLEKDKECLQKEAARVADAMKLSEKEFSNLAADLEDELEKAKSQCAFLQQQYRKKEDEKENVSQELRRKLSDSYAERMKAESILKEEMSTLRTRSAQAKQELEEKLHAALSTISKKTKSNSALEQVVTSLRAELDARLNSEKNEKQQYEARSREQKNVISTLSHEIEQMRSGSEREARLRDEEIGRMERKVRSCDLKIMTQEQELENLKGTLAERTKLLGDMVKQNRTLEDDLAEARSLVNDLQEESERYLKAKDSAAARATQLEKKRSEREDRLLDALQQERGLREKAEADFCKINESVETMKRAGKDISELERENTMLKDKVVRQEQYLKRKLKQEKVLKERLAGGSRYLSDGAASHTSSRYGSDGTSSQISWDLEED